MSTSRTSEKPRTPTYARPRSPTSSAPRDHGKAVMPHALDPNHLADHVDRLYRAAWALCGSQHDAEDLVQETFANVLKRPRLLRHENEIGYLIRALKNTYANRYRAAARRPLTCPLQEDAATAPDDATINGREVMQAIADTPPLYRDAVIAVDLLGLSYREAARSFRTSEATITSRLHRGRQHVARRLTDETTSPPTARTPVGSA